MERLVGKSFDIVGKGREMTVCGKKKTGGFFPNIKAFSVREY